MRPELESIYLTAPIGLGVLDTDLRFIRVNERLAEMNGLAIAEHLGRKVSELLPELDHRVHALLQRVLRTGEPLRDLEVRGRTPAQPGVERIWVEQITALRDEGGRIQGLSIVAEEVTAQRQAQQALARSQESLALAMEAAGLAVWEWNISSNELAFGDNWEQLLGYGPHERGWSRADWHALMHPDDREGVIASIEAHVAGETLTFECEYRLKHSNGQWVWISSRGRVVEWDANGKPLRMSGVGRDITAQREVQQQLKRQAQLLQLSFDAIFTWDDESGIQSWNRGAELQYGYAQAQALGVHPDVLLQTQFPCPRKEVADALEADGVWRGQLVHRTRDGRQIVVAAVLQRVVSGDARTLEITRDITQAKRNEALLVQSERELRHWRERLQVALDAGRMGVWEWTPGGDSFWSAEVYKLLGLEHDSGSAGAFHFLQMIHPEDRAKVDAEIGRVLAKGGTYESEFRVVRADGQVRWLVSRGSAMTEDAHKASRLVGVHFDITDRKMVEDELRQADVRRTEFLAMLAHELRNPLAPIVNAVRLLEVLGEAPETREAATQILRRQTTHLARLVDDLLEASRITQGRIELRIENVLLATCVFQAVEAARAQARAQHQTLKVEIPPALDFVADPARVTQIIANLVTNAVKYTPEGGEIEVTAEAQPDDQLAIIVQDNGPGIPVDLQPRIFDLFMQGASTLHRSDGGLGIGLALVKRLAELHGGHVRYEPRPDGTAGARFVVCLPRTGRRDELRGSGLAAYQPRLAPLSIVVVDDNEDAAQSLAALLRLDGHRVDVAHDGEQAVTVSVQVRPRLVILDLGLPRLDGLAVARRLRQDDRFDDTVLIAVSGYAQAADRAATAEAGFDDHLAKPVSLADLYRAVEGALA